MNEHTIMTMIKHIGHIQNAPENFAIQLVEFDRAIEWAKNYQKWDLIIDLTTALSHMFILLRPYIQGNETEEQKLVKLKKLKEKGKEYAAKGLNIAKQAGNQTAQLRLLQDLIYFAVLLNEFELLVEYTSRQLALVPKEDKWDVAYESYKLSRQISPFKKRDSRIIRRLLQISLDIYYEINDEVAIAEMSLYLGQLELDLDNIETAKQIFEKGLKIGKQAKHWLSVSNSLERLGTIFQRKGNKMRARAMFEEALKVLDKVDNSSSLQLREDLQRKLQSLRDSEQS